MCGISGFYSINAFDFNNRNIKDELSPFLIEDQIVVELGKIKIQELFLVIRDYQF